MDAAEKHCLKQVLLIVKAEQPQEPGDTDDPQKPGTDGEQTTKPDKNEDVCRYSCRHADHDCSSRNRRLRSRCDRSSPQKKMRSKNWSAE